MIKTKKELLLISLVGFLSSAVSYVFTILMLMSFAETTTEKILYFLCGVIIDGVKWFSLITMIKYYRAKLYKNFYAYSILFFMFFAMSVTASVSYSIYTVKKQMYDVKTIENKPYIVAQEQLNKLKNDVVSLETERTNELTRINKEVDGLPLDYVTRRKELSAQKIELTNLYDGKIAVLKAEIETKIKELNTLDNTSKEVKTLKNNAIAGFFETISNVLNVSIDNIIIFFAIALGIILDMASIALTFDKAFSYQNKRSFKRDITNYKNIKLLNEKLKFLDEDTGEKILNYSDFVDFIQTNKIDIDSLSFTKVQDLLPKSSFYKFKDKFKTEMEQESEIFEDDRVEQSISI